MGSRWRWLGAFSLVLLLILRIMTGVAQDTPKLLTDPFLQQPTADSVQVVWFTEWEGIDHRVRYGAHLEKIAIASTKRLTRTREDAQSHLFPVPTGTVERPIWRHQATITRLISGKFAPYQVFSAFSQKKAVNSGIFRLTALPRPDQPLKILLTSDHQLMPMVAANLQKMKETVGQVDAVFFAGDLVNVADRASEWFDDQRGGAFFPCLQGKADSVLRSGIPYRGAAILQNAPIFPTIGNHEVMGRFSETSPLNEQFKDAFPRDRPLDDTWDETIKNKSFNTDTYEEIFSLPSNDRGNSRYYALTFGNIRLISLYVTNIWRSPVVAASVKGRYQEADKDLDNPDQWGYGQHIFEAITPDSDQYRWLKAELASPEFVQATYKIVMFHHPPHTLGDNIVPAYTEPVLSLTYDDQNKVQSVRYDYPREKDYIIQYLLPLLEEAGVDLVFYGHSHLWNRFISPTGMHFLESSNVGNSYGAFLAADRRPIPPDRSEEQYSPYGDPNGLDAIIPTLSPLKDENNQLLPYIASNTLTVFSIFETASGKVSSYRFDTSNPNSEVVKFDEFPLDHGAK